MTSTIPFDVVAVQKLISSAYCVKQVDIAKWLGKSASWVNSHIREGELSGEWLNRMEDINQAELSIINTMVKTENITYIDEDNEIVVAIRHYYEGGSEGFCVFIRNKSVVKCVFEVSEDLKSAFYEKGFNKLSEIDLEIKQMLDSIVILGQKLAKPRDNVAKKKLQNSISRMYQYWSTTYDEYCQELGFDGYLPDDELRTYNKYKEQIKQYIRYDNKIYISSDAPLYKRMYRFAQYRGVSFNFFLNELGYERIYDRSYDLEEELFNSPDENMDRINMLLKRLKNIQGTLNKIGSESLRRERSKTLVKYLKLLYSNRCQICKDKIDIPMIERLDGTYYVEVHHMTPISQTDSLEEEQEWLDTYKNTIVVCAHHHKYLHYHHGGFKKVEQDEKGIFFVSERGTTIRLYRNYHFGII